MTATMTEKTTERPVRRINKPQYCSICGCLVTDCIGRKYYCKDCYEQNRRNAAEVSHKRARVERERMEREAEEMKKTGRMTTVAAESKMRILLSKIGSMTDGQLSTWTLCHKDAWDAWHEAWTALNEGMSADGATFPEHLPDGFPIKDQKTAEKCGIIIAI